MAELTCAFDYDNVVDLNKTLQAACADNFDYICVPLVHPRFERQIQSGLPDRQAPLTRSDLLLAGYSWSQSVVGKISPWLNFDSDVESQRFNARSAFKQEIAWATHLGLSSTILPQIDWNCHNFASCVSSALLNLSYMKLWLQVPLVSKKELMLTSQAKDGEEINLPPQDDSWEQWNKFRTLCGHHKSLSVVLEITENLPAPWIIDRWLSEPVVALLLPVNIFLTNPKGYPVLTKPHQEVIKKLFRNNVQVIIKGHVTHPKGQSVYQQYVAFLWKQVTPLSDLERYEKPYWDYLQAPLQPLMDNLESSTYETFEKDPTKYQKYQDAIALCLKTDPFLKDKDEIVLMVLGAGRGPLVFAAMRAATETGRKLKLFALEKNPNAVNTLMNLKYNHPDWADVTVVNTDIRKWSGDQADVVVSELLGSFGDNELSPECLYGAQDILKKGGISIPQQYVSFINPLSSVKLWNECRTVYDDDCLRNFETAYVVKFHAVHHLTEPQTCFEFIHPDYSEPNSSNRHTKFSFPIKNAAMFHGFAGYFDSKLYGDVHISIEPSTFTDGMFSWFPLYFPVRTPTYIPPNSVVEVDFWRLSNSKQVWYEWSFSLNGYQSPIHNPNGRSWFIGL